MKSFNLKLFGAFVLFAAIASPLCADCVTVGLNFYTSGEGDLTRVGKLPAGVTIMAKKKFDNPKLQGFCRYIVIDLDKCTSIDMKFVVAGKGQIFPSVSAWKGKIGASPNAKVKCVKFEFNDEVCAQKPFVFGKYRRMAPNNGFEDGDVITVRAGFAKAE